MKVPSLIVKLKEFAGPKILVSIKLAYRLNQWTVLNSVGAVTAAWVIPAWTWNNPSVTMQMEGVEHQIVHSHKAEAHLGMWSSNNCWGIP